MREVLTSLYLIAGRVGGQAFNKSEQFRDAIQLAQNAKILQRGSREVVDEFLKKVSFIPVTKLAIAGWAQAWYLTWR